MTIQATDVEQLEKPSAPVPAQEELPMQEQTAPLVAAPRTRGRPAGSKDKQPRKRPARAAAWADVAGEEEEEEETQEPPPRPPTRRRSSAPKKKSSAPRRRVQIVTEESASSSAEEEEEEEEAPPPSPRTTRHQQWAVYRQQKADVHQANVNRYAALFDRMLA